MSIERVVNVLDHAPAGLTAAERLLLVALAELARTDQWSVPTDTLLRRTGLRDARSLRAVLQRLAGRGIELRIPLGKGGRGRPLYALKGIAPTYRIPVFAAPQGCTCSRCKQQASLGGTATPPPNVGGTTLPDTGTTVPLGGTTVSPGDTTVPPNPSVIPKTEGRAPRRAAQRRAAAPAPKPKPPLLRVVEGGHQTSHTQTGLWPTPVEDSHLGLLPEPNSQRPGSGSRHRTRDAGVSATPTHQIETPQALPQVPVPAAEQAWTAEQARAEARRIATTARTRNRRTA